MHALPPYALRPAEFRFRAVAALAARLTLGGDREVLLAVLVAARLALGAIGPHALAEHVRRQRAQGARTWFSTLALPAAARTACLRVAEASAGTEPGPLATAFDAVLEVATGMLDGSSRAELQALARSLAPAAA